VKFSDLLLHSTACIAREVEVLAICQRISARQSATTSAAVTQSLALVCRSATCLLKRLEHTHSALMAVRHMLPSVPDAAKTLNNYEQTHIALEGFIFSKHDEWFKTIDNSIKNHLQNSLLTQDKADRECDIWRLTAVGSTEQGSACTPAQQQ
jgi:hypothetical protein